MSGFVKMASTKKILIVDGYNVLRTQERYSHISQPDWTDNPFNHARDCLINDIMKFMDSQTRGIVVFDGARNAFSEGLPKHLGPLEIIFSKRGVDADQVVIDRASSYKNNGYAVTVVTSDAEVQNSVMGRGVVRMSARDFVREIREIDSQVEESSKVTFECRATVKNSIDEETLSKLLEIRDGIDR